MKAVLILASVLIFPATALSKVARVECTSSSAQITLLEEFSGNGYKVILSKVAVLGQSRSGFDVLFPDQRVTPATLFTAALPGYTVALTLPSRTAELLFTDGEETTKATGQVVINGGHPESMSCSSGSTGPAARQ